LVSPNAETAQAHGYCQLTVLGFSRPNDAPVAKARRILVKQSARYARMRYLWCYFDPSNPGDGVRPTNLARSLLLLHPPLEVHAYLHQLDLPLETEQLPFSHIHSNFDKYKIPTHHMLSSCSFFRLPSAEPPNPIIFRDPLFIRFKETQRGPPYVVGPTQISVTHGPKLSKSMVGRNLLLFIVRQDTRNAPA
jgi:hypothetical protein